MRLCIFIAVLVGFSLFSCNSHTDSEAIPAAETILPVEANTQQTKPLILPEVATPEKPLYVALLVTEGVYNTELTAPMDIFHHTKFRGENHLIVYTVAMNPDPITKF